MERWNDPEEGSEEQDVNMNVTKARNKMCFANTVITQSKCTAEL